MRAQWQWLAPMVWLVIASTALLAQSPGRGMRNYDPSTEAKFSGVIENVYQANGKCCAGTHFTVKTEAETLDVHVGPAGYISQQQFSFTKGDQVEILGSRVKMNGSEAVIAREITKDNKTLVLRNAQGIPQWSGRGARAY